jgi:hypothetical protein
VVSRAAFGVDADVEDPLPRRLPWSPWAGMSSTSKRLATEEFEGLLLPLPSGLGLGCDARFGGAASA